MEDLKSGIEHLRQAKAHMSKANGIMSNHISKLKELEEENAGLRAKLEAFIQSDDSYMRLPLDADGEPIHIGDVLYSSGNECRVVSITVKADEAYVGVYTDEGVFLPSVNPKYLSRKNLEPLEPEPADSWERLEEDAAKEVCAYAGASFSIVDQDRYSCTGCRFDDCSSRKTSCWLQMNSELMARAKKLAGIEEEAQR